MGRAEIGYVSGMRAIAHHVHLHLAGSAAGIDLFDRSARAQRDPETADAVRQIHAQLVDERRALRAMADRLDVGESPVLTLGARLAERLGRLKPNGRLLERTAVTDLIELEAMCDAVAGKVTGWRALLAVCDHVDGLERVELELLLDQGLTQHRRLSELHELCASRVLPGLV